MTEHVLLKAVDEELGTTPTLIRKSNIDIVVPIDGKVIAFCEGTNLELDMTFEEAVKAITSKDSVDFLDILKEFEDNPISSVAGLVDDLITGAFD